MTTSLNKVFEVDRPIGEVWSNFIDPEKVVGCVPGASLTEKLDEDHYKGHVELKIGPVKAGYDGLITFEQRDTATHSMSLKGTGTDTRGKGGAEMNMSGQLTEKGAGTEVNVKMELSITGMLAQMGSRVVGDVSNQVFDQFVNNFRAQLTGGKVDPKLHTGSMMGSAIKGLFKGKHE